MGWSVPMRELKLGQGRHSLAPSGSLSLATKRFRLWQKNCDGCFFENNCEVLVAELSNAEHIVLESRHDVGFAIW
jgi:hypothetical protein